MIIRLVLVTAMLAAMTSLWAAPPRFSGYDMPTIPKSSSEQETAQKAPVQANTTPSVHGNPAPKVEFVDGKLVTKVPTEQAENTEMTGPTSENPEAVAKEKPERRKPLFSLFRRKPVITEKTYKQPDALINSQEHHESKIDQLGIADTHRFQVGYQNFWKVDSSKVMCSMKQKIPGYGHVEFRQGVGQPLEFALYVSSPPAGLGKAHIRTEPPQWRHFSQAKDLGVIEIEAGDKAVSASTEWANRFLLELSEGMQPIMRYWDAADASDQIEILLSSINFQQSLDLFNRCLGQMLRYDFKSVKRTIVHFHADSSKLRTKATAQLDELLETFREDKGIKQIDLELYTHSKGLVRYNFRLATRRARAVRDYFIKRGVPENKIVIKIHTHKKSKLDSMGYKATDVHIVLQRKTDK